MSIIVFIGLVGIIPVAIAARLFGDLIVTLGKLDGWNQKRAFWIGAIVYALICVGVYWGCLIGFDGLTYTSLIIVLAPLYIAPIFPVINYFVKRANPDVFIPKVKPADLVREVTKNPPFAFFEPSETRVEAANEIVNVPPGVTIRVKRSRTVQHTISVRWGASGELAGNLNLVNIVNLSIKTAIEKEKQATYQESETIEYEVELNGNTSRSYTLVWTDIWKPGFVDVNTKAQQQRIPFEYRERSELDVRPIYR